MIETSRSIAIRVPIEGVWDYVRDIRRWSTLFPGCQGCEVVDDDRSNWVIKVGAGGLVRTVNVQVRVDRWAGPEAVDFSFDLAAEPVTGRGSYTAARDADGGTEIALMVRVEGSGPMAPLWEAVSTPLLPQLAQTFAARLKTEVENAAGITAAARPTLAGRLLDRLRAVWRRLFGTAAS